MPDFKTSGGEVRFVDFVTEDHMRKVRGAIAEAGIDLRVFQDGALSRFSDVREMARRQVALDDETWQAGVRELCKQVVETGGAIREQTPYDFCEFGLAINNPNYVGAVRTGPGSWSWPAPHEPKLLFMKEQDLLEGIYPVGVHPVGGMAVALQYREFL